MMLKRVGKSLQDNNGLFFLVLALWLASGILSTTLLEGTISPYRKAVSYSCLIIMALLEVKKSYWNKRELAGIVLCVILAAAFINSGITHLIQTLFIVYCARRIPFSQIAKLCLLMTCITCLFVIGLSQIGVLNDFISISGSRVRHYLGFRYALYPAQFMFTITCLVAVLREGGFKPIDFLVLLVANYAVYYLTVSRLAFICSLLVLLGIPFVNLLKTVFKIKHKPGLFIAACAYPCAFAISMYFALAYDPSIAWMSAIDSNGVLSGRIAMSHKGLDLYDITLIGQQIDIEGLGLQADGSPRQSSGAYFYIDNLYIQSALRYGAIFIMVYLVCMSLVTVRQYRKQNHSIVIVLIIIALLNIIQDYMLILVFNPFLFLLGDLFESRAMVVSESRAQKNRWKRRLLVS